MGQIIKKKKVEKKTHANYAPPWWVNPFFYISFFLLPFFLITVYSAGPYMHKLGQSVNNLTTDNIVLGGLSIAMLALGTLPFALSKQTKIKQPQLDLVSVNKALVTMGLISLFCNLIFFFPLFLRPDLFISLLTGSSSAMYEIRRTAGQIPGITSFISACLPFFALYSFMRIEVGTKKLWAINRKLLIILFVFVAMRAIFSSERLALVEAAVAFGVPYIAFSWRPSFARMMVPFAGLAGVFSLFCIGEYFRSWQFYQDKYDSFWEFITVRFFGYFATSLNNGAGVISNYPEVGMPAHTASGVYKLFAIFGENYNPGIKQLQEYLSRFATPEFNNPGGLYIPYMDYGIVGGAIFCLVMGAVTGGLFVLFRNKRSLGLLLYPSWFLALLDIIRVWIWGNSRFVPVILIALLAYIIVSYKKEPRKLI